MHINAIMIRKEIIFLTVFKKWYVYLLYLIIATILLSGCGYTANNNGFFSMEQYEETMENQDKISSRNVEQAMKAGDKKEAEVKNTINDLINEPAKKNKESLPETLLRGFYNTYIQIKLWAPWICIGSFMIGMIIFMSARGNKRARKFGLFGLVIGVPLCMLFIVFGIGFLNGMFLY